MNARAFTSASHANRRTTTDTHQHENYGRSGRSNGDTSTSRRFPFVCVYYRRVRRERSRCYARVTHYIRTRRTHIDRAPGLSGRRFCMQMSVNREVIPGRAYQINFVDIALMAVTARRELPTGSLPAIHLRYIGLRHAARGSLMSAA